MNNFLMILSLFLLISCGYGEKTKDLGKDIVEDLSIGNPLAVSNQKQALANAREEIVKNKNKYNKCLKKNSGDESACTESKARYDESVGRYVEIQKR